MDEAPSRSLTGSSLTWMIHRQWIAQLPERGREPVVRQARLPVAVPRRPRRPALDPGRTRAEVPHSAAAGLGAVAGTVGGWLRELGRRGVLTGATGFWLILECGLSCGAAVNPDVLRGHPAGGVAGQERDDRGDLIRPPQPSE